MRPIPPDLLRAPFDRETALRLGVTARVLEGVRFVRLFPGVYRHRQHVMTSADWVLAARLALPADALVTGLTRIQELGLELGPRRPLRFVVEGDLHLAIDEVFLHRTKRLPPHDHGMVTPAAAYLAYCRRARVIDAIKVGDWLLHHGHMRVREVEALALAEQWRDGANEALYVLARLNGDARSLPESEMRVLLVAAGLPAPEVNLGFELDGDRVIGDLVYREWRTFVEYEGAHHQQERGQYVSDIDRYALLRRHDISYVQVTHESLRNARAAVTRVSVELRGRGYDGPAPTFGPVWAEAFVRVTDLVGRRGPHRSAVG